MGKDVVGVRIEDREKVLPKAGCVVGLGKIRREEMERVAIDRRGFRYGICEKRAPFPGPCQALAVRASVPRMAVCARWERRRARPTPGGNQIESE